MSQTFFIRVDAGSSAGLGHLSRCTVLGHELKRRGCPVTFITSAPDVYKASLERVGMKVTRSAGQPGSAEDIENLLQAVHWDDGVGLIVDGYSFGLEYLTETAGSVAFLTVIDDMVRLPRYPVNFLIDHNPGAELRAYPVPEGAVTLLGPQHLLVSPGLASSAATRSKKRQDGDVKRVLISMGGSNLHSFSERALRAVLKVAPNQFVDVIMGPGSDPTEVMDMAEGMLNVQIHRSPPDLYELILQADLAISAGGMTMMELSTAGVPTIVTILAENQRPPSEYLAGRGGIRLLGPYDEVTDDELCSVIEELVWNAEARRELSARAALITDGRGAARVADALLPCVRA